MIVWFIIGCFAVWRLTWDLTSCTPENDGTCKPNLEGPFHLYDGIRWVLTRPQLPKWVQEGSACPFCVSMWAAGFVALLMPPGRESIASWLVWTISLSSPTALFLRYVKSIYGIPPREF